MFWRMGLGCRVRGLGVWGLRVYLGVWGLWGFVFRAFRV